MFIAVVTLPVDVHFTTAVVVQTDSVPEHWRKWPVLNAEGLSRGERCRYRVDASRVLRHKAVTQGLPRRCMTKFDRAQRPDPKP